MIKIRIAFAPKYRRMIVYGKLRAKIGGILRDLCNHQGVEILEANACPDHIHMLVSIPPKMSVSYFINVIKLSKYYNNRTRKMLSDEQSLLNIFIFKHDKYR